MSHGRQPVPLRRAQFDDVSQQSDRAKTITLYVNGDEHFYGMRMSVSRRNTQTWDSFMRQATNKTGVVFAARDILTPTHGTKVNSLEELADGSSYVVISRGSFKPIG